jgi:hypothetical protein
MELLAALTEVDLWITKLVLALVLIRGTFSK